MQWNVLQSVVSAVSVVETSAYEISLSSSVSSSSFAKTGLSRPSTSEEASTKEKSMMRGDLGMLPGIRKPAGPGL